MGIFASSIFCRGKRILGYNGIELLNYTVGLYGPQRWNIEYPSCAYPNQSPVNFETEGSELYEKFTDSTLALYSSVIAVNSVLAHENTSIATQKKVSIYIQAPLARLQIGENIYSLFLTEIHTSSEHRIDGKDFVAEAQFYFRKESPESIKAKLRVLYPSGPNQECFSEYGKYYDACKVRFNGAFMKDTEEPDEIVAIGALVGIEDESSDFISQVANAYSSPYSLFKLDYSSVFSKIQNSSSFYSYKGSYTSPPCYKNVNWLVSTSELLTISVDDLKKIQQVQGYNSRETQPFGPGRESDIFNKK